MLKYGQAILLLQFLFVPLFASAVELAIFRTTNNAVELRWPSQTGWDYSIYTSTNLIGNYTLHASGQQATPPENTFWEIVNADTRFYVLGYQGVLANSQIKNGETI